MKRRRGCERLWEWWGCHHGSIGSRGLSRWISYKFQNFIRCVILARLSYINVLFSYLSMLFSICLWYYLFCLLRIGFHDHLTWLIFTIVVFLILIVNMAVKVFLFCFLSTFCLTRSTSMSQMSPLPHSTLHTCEMIPTLKDFLMLEFVVILIVIIFSAGDLVANSSNFTVFIFLSLFMLALVSYVHACIACASIHAYFTRGCFT